MRKKSSCSTVGAIDLTIEGLAQVKMNPTIKVTLEPKAAVNSLVL